MCNCEDAPCCGCDPFDSDARSDQEIKDAVYARFNDPNWDDDHDFDTEDN